MKYEIYTDGSAIGNSPYYYGGWGMAVLVNGEKIYELSDGDYPSTNNRMELTAILAAIKYIKEKYHFGDECTIYTDSNYSLQCVTNWVKRWVNNGWQNSKKEPVINKDLVEEIYSMLQKMPYVTIVKVKGHSTNEWNNYVDGLATHESHNQKMKKIKEEVGM